MAFPRDPSAKGLRTGSVKDPMDIPGDSSAESTLSGANVPQNDGEKAPAE